ncbi:MAG: hypothetical protein IJW54_00130 [Clostridia bacterium]|nr:hypothetical protein [Clostridia bacterium]
MKLFKRIGSFVVVAVMLFALLIPVSAANVTSPEIAPCYNNTASTEIVFVIDENGVASVSYTCIGYRGIVSSIKTEIQIQKKVGTSWADVEGASWIDESSVYFCTNTHDYQLSETGTYKAVVTFTVSGSGGAADVITREIEKTY